MGLGVIHFGAVFGSLPSKSPISPNAPVSLHETYHGKDFDRLIKAEVSHLREINDNLATHFEAKQRPRGNVHRRTGVIEA